MPLPEARNFEIVTPLLTVLKKEDGLRLPNLGEVLLCQGLTLQEIQGARIGGLVVGRSANRFTGRLTPWHYDMIHTQGHFTDEGAVKSKLAGITGEVPSQKMIRNITEELDEKALVVDVTVRDLLIYGGARSEFAVAHHVEATAEPRGSHIIPIRI